MDTHRLELTISPEATAKIAVLEEHLRKISQDLSAARQILQGIGDSVEVLTKGSLGLAQPLLSHLDGVATGTA
jgi:hypothetical protein